VGKKRFRAQARDKTREKIARQMQSQEQRKSCHDAQPAVDRTVGEDGVPSSQHEHEGSQRPPHGYDHRKGRFLEATFGPQLQTFPSVGRFPSWTLEQAEHRADGAEVGREQQAEDRQTDGRDHFLRSTGS
jgi:hypothetical protein